MFLTNSPAPNTNWVLRCVVRRHSRRRLRRASPGGYEKASTRCTSRTRRSRRRSSRLSPARRTRKSALTRTLPGTMFRSSSLSRAVSRQSLRSSAAIVDEASIVDDLGRAATDEAKLTNETGPSYASTCPSGGPRPSTSGNASPCSVNDSDTELRQ